MNEWLVGGSNWLTGWIDESNKKFPCLFRIASIPLTLNKPMLNSELEDVRQDGHPQGITA